MNIIYLTNNLKINADGGKHDFYCDVETLAYNTKQGKEVNVKLQKNIVYSFACSYIIEDTCYVSEFPSIADFFSLLRKKLANKLTGKVKNKTHVRLIYHNGNKYDNHYLLYDLKYFYQMPVYNIFIKQAVQNKDTVKLAQMKNNTILEKRVKTKNNLELNFMWENIKFTTIDSVLKTGGSIEVLGKKLNKANLLGKEYLKTSFEYTVYDKEEDMTDDQAREYALRCFNSLNAKQMQYIRNDVIILGFGVHFYSTIYPQFDFEKFSLTTNIAARFTETTLAKFQMLNKVDKEETGGRPIHVKYTDYAIGDLNLYEYFKRAYNGGSNFYNQTYVNKMITSPVVGIDINHSYPYAMDSQMIPTFITMARKFDKFINVKVKDKPDKFSIYEVDKTYFNTILRKIPSDLVRRIIVKYYNNKFDTVYVNTNTLRLIALFTKEPILEIECIRLVEFDCVEFGNKEFLRENYYIKQQGSSEYDLTFHGDPYHYTLDTSKLNTSQLTNEEISIAKAYNNGGYGFPALKPYFNLFRMNEEKDDYHNLINGFKNTERNIVFSLFVTSCAFLNLLTPLSYLEGSFIDTDVYYGDTDSLYMSKKAFEQLPEHLFDDYRLGAWGLDVEANKMFILNHKKYALELTHKSDKPRHVIGDKEIKIISGGIAKEKVFDVSQYETFEDFIKYSFSHKVVLGVDKTVMNYQGVLTFYKAVTTLKKGDNYADYFSRYLTNKINELLQKIEIDLTENGIEDLVYIESMVGSFGIGDVFAPKFEYEGKKDANKLVGYVFYIKDMLY